MELEKKNAYRCSNSFLNFTDGSQLTVVTCSLFNGKSKLLLETEASPFFLFLQNLANAIMNGGDSDQKKEITEESASARAKIEVYKNQVSQTKAGVDAYFTAANLEDTSSPILANHLPPSQ